MAVRSSFEPRLAASLRAVGSRVQAGYHDLSAGVGLSSALPSIHFVPEGLLSPAKHILHELINAYLFYNDGTQQRTLQCQPYPCQGRRQLDWAIVDYRRSVGKFRPANSVSTMPANRPDPWRGQVREPQQRHRGRRHDGRGDPQRRGGPPRLRRHHGPDGEDASAPSQAASSSGTTTLTTVTTMVRYDQVVDKRNFEFCSLIDHLGSAVCDTMDNRILSHADTCDCAGTLLFAHARKRKPFVKLDDVNRHIFLKSVVPAQVRRLRRRQA